MFTLIKLFIITNACVIVQMFNLIEICNDGDIFTVAMLMILETFAILVRLLTLVRLTISETLLILVTSSTLVNY